MFQRTVLRCSVAAFERLEDDLDNVKSFPIWHSCDTLDVAFHFEETRGLSVTYRATKL